LHHYKHETIYSFPTPINLFETTSGGAGVEPLSSDEPNKACDIAT
jgi:hypothetical protein